jgi:hypothetical protein
MICVDLVFIIYLTTMFVAARVFPAFSSYGSDAAFQVTPIPPQYTSAPNGSYLKMKRSVS